MREDSQRNTISGQKDEVTLEITVDKKTNEYLVRISKDFVSIDLPESEARWLGMALLYFRHPEDRHTNVYEAFQEALDQEIDHEVFYGTNEKEETES